jgi:hypothetical protein
MDNPTYPELTESVASIDRHLKDILSVAIGVDDELSLYRRQRFPQPIPRNTASWPWAPGTLAQGFLGARWNRRDGNVYATPNLRAVSGPNSPIR